MLRTATRVSRRPLVAQRPSSSVAHDEHHDHHQEQDDTVYPKEGFGAPIWRKTLVFTIGAALFYEYLGAPADNEKPWLPATGVATTESLIDIASARAAKESALQGDRQLVRSAVRPPIYRSRNPENFLHVSPYGNPVGMTVEWSRPSKSPMPSVAALSEAARK
ncbi:hypothetical protein DFH06DRAFT_1231557 [Mycena polygramma]|nr:hypothetical protein DFH06DRAFT_1231557 [Mycena polygramma]